MEYEVRRINNNTGLGLLFTQTVIDLPQHNGVPGHVKLANCVETSEDLFSVFLP